MAVTLEQVRGVLSPDEVDYAEALKLGPDALPHLETLVEGGALHLAAKAAYLAGLIQDERSAAVLSKAARSPQLPVRLAAASTARNLSRPSVNRVLLELVGDGDHVVRREALKSVTLEPTPELRARIEAVSRDDALPDIRDLAAQTLRRRNPR
ncbi:MAG TPA: HEAT repeat domain-containing protein [Pyrinomonadaceae bacterium]|nr:HEAT repeat domain-containing protein [Pyrinomonadaceae bacterium]